MKIKTRLLIILLTFSIIPALFIGALFYNTSMGLLKRNVLSGLSSASTGMEAALLEFLESKRARTVDFSTDAFIVDTLKAINFSKNPGERDALGARLSDYIKANKITIDQDIVVTHVLDLSGKIVASTDRKVFGQDWSGEPFFSFSLMESYIQDISFRKTIPVSAPVKRAGAAYGVIVNEFSQSIIADILSAKRLEDLGMKHTEFFKAPDLYLVDRTANLIAAGQEFPEKQADIKNLFPVKSCLESSMEINGQWQGVSGRPVFGASECIMVRNGPVWVLLAEADRESVVLFELRGVRDVALVSGASLAVVVVFSAFAIALSISKPLDRLKKGTARIATGDLDYKVGTEEQDEIGELSRAFDKMTEDLKKVTASRDEFVFQIKERIKAERDLLASEEKYRSLVENAPVGVYTSREGRFIYVNKAFSEMFGFDSPEELVGTATVDRYKDLMRRQMLLKEIREKGRVTNFEVEAVTKNGETKNVLLSASIEGSVLTGVVLDITDRKRAEEIKKEAARSKALAEMSAVVAETGMELGAMLDTIARYIGDNLDVLCVIRLVSKDGSWLDPAAIHHKDPVLLKRAKGVIKKYPKSVESGVGAKEVKLGKQVLLRSLDEREEDISVRDFWKGLEDMGINNVLVTPLKSYGRVIGTIGVFRGVDTPFTEDEMAFMQDLSDRVALAISNARLFGEVQKELELRKQAQSEMKKYAAELEKSNEDLQRFAYVASHDLSEPLRMISSFVQLLQKRYADRLDANADEYIRFAVEGTVRMQRMISDLLEYSRVQTKGRPFESISMEEALRQAGENLRIAVKESGAEITHGPLPSVTADPIQMMQLFQNLIGNAIKFRSGRPLKIHISAEDRRGETVFSVVDNGEGIEEKYRDKIFELFARLHGREYPGTGLGLAICKRIVERHGGRIWVDSEPGKGSAFYFSIPKR